MGAKLRRELVTELARGGRFAEDWMLTQFVTEWPFPIMCEGRMRFCAAPGCPKCKRRAVTIERGATQLARPLRAYQSRFGVATACVSRC